MTVACHRYPIDLTAVESPVGEELSPRNTPETKSNVKQKHQFEEIANFVRAASSSNDKVNAAWECLDSARTHGTVGSHNASDGTADSIEILDGLRCLCWRISVCWQKTVSGICFLPTGKQTF